ncbi:MAG: Hsp20/alpha crystallin family protein [Armatimonadetes bacterium]|jgi:HSP20 family protein|nr:Hsp20/alpha crystallin family protein [Armatimonadota bacterium]
MEQDESKTGTEHESPEEQASTETSKPAAAEGKSSEVIDTVKSWLGTVGESVSHIVSTVAGSRPWVPATDVYTTDTELVVLADLPGVSTDALKVDPTPLSLILTGAGEADDREEAVEYSQRGRPRGDFEVHLDLPAEIKHGQVSAKIKRGVLEVRAPLAVVEKPTVTVIQEEDGEE